MGFQFNSSKSFAPFVFNECSSWASVSCPSKPSPGPGFFPGCSLSVWNFQKEGEKRWTNFQLCATTPSQASSYHMGGQTSIGQDWEAEWKKEMSEKDSSRANQHYFESACVFDVKLSSAFKCPGSKGAQCTLPLPKHSSTGSTSELDGDLTMTLRRRALRSRRK